MMVYIRPKYLKSRSDFSRESRIWALRRAVWGRKVRPVHSLHGAIDIKGDDSKGKKNTQQQALSKEMISSLTNGSGGGGAREEVSDHEEKADRSGLYQQGKPSGGLARRSNSLEIISETAESNDANRENGGTQKIESSDKRLSIVQPDKGSSAVILMDGSIIVQKSPRRPAGPLQ